ncbi:MAG: hypothetical protein ACI8RZ_006169 [Myxococcota bacterium]|jgi:hypothetical protein
MSLSSLLLLLPSLAGAAEVTELAPQLRGDLGFRFDSFTQYDRLHEDGEQVGRRQLNSNQLTLAGAFSFIDGAGLFFEIPRISDRISYPEANLMAFDPNSDSGTMLGTEALTGDVGLEGAGFGGTWLGLRGSPIHEDLFAHRGDRSSWLFEAGYRFADKTHLWTVDSGQRGSGPGASAYRLHGAFSTTHRASRPYLTATFLQSGRLTTDVTDETGTLISNAEISPASRMDLKTGSELYVWVDEDSGSQISLDFSASFGYRSWQTIPSGTYLPSILDASSNVLILESEVTTLDVGFGINARIMEYAQLNIGGEVGTISPQRIEHLYSVETAPGTLDWQLHVEVRFRARDPMFDSLK